MTERAIEMLELPPDQPAFLLDIGCGSGLSGEWLSEAGHHWIGVDISPSMLGTCVKSLFVLTILKGVLIAIASSSSTGMHLHACVHACYW